MFGLILGAICISSAPILVKLSGLEPTSLAFFRCFFAFFFLLPFFSFSKPNKKSLSSKSSLFIFLAALCFALDLYVWHRSIYIVGAGMATILGNSQALYLSIFGVLFFQEKPKPRFFVALILAFVGIYLLVDPLGNIERPENYLLGVIFGLATGLFYSGYILFLRMGQSEKQKRSPAHQLGLVCGITSLMLFGVSSVETSFTYPSDGMIWLWTVLLALVPQVFGWIFISRSLPKVPVSRSGLILLLQPVLASVFGMILFKEYLSTSQILGGVIALFAIYLGNTVKKSKTKTA